MRPPEPLISVILPAWRSTGTLGASLDALRAQSYPRFEVIVVDSSPPAPGAPDPTAALIAQRFPAARYLHIPHRLTPHAARTVGAAHARGDLFAFTDPDIYPRPLWLAQLVAAHERLGGVIVGTLACAGSRRFDQGVHLTKFHLGLAPLRSGQPPRRITRGWSGNLLIDRATFYAAGGWPWVGFQGDTIFTAALDRAGVPLWLAPDAVVEHDHEGVRMGAFLRERFVRGREFVRLEAAGAIDGAPWSATQRRRQKLTAAALPLKIALSSVRTLHDAHAAGHLRTALITLPIIVAGRAAWLAGRAWGAFAPG